MAGNWIIELKERIRVNQSEGEGKMEEIETSGGKMMIDTETEKDKTSLTLEQWLSKQMAHWMGRTSISDAV